MKNQTELIREILIKIEYNSTITYDDILNKVKLELTRKYLSNVFSKLLREGIVSKVENGKYKKEQVQKTSLFVYGSLKIGFHNHKILEGAIFSGKATTVKKFAMFESNNGAFPRLVETKSEKAKKIYGQVFEIYNPELLRKIDNFEGLNYERKKIKIENSEGKIQYAFVYVSNNVELPKEVTFISSWKKYKKDFNKAQAIKIANAFLQNQRNKIDNA
jgi:gamma-glutamylcyclotransferase (GGCT)/AIG2-like uncharacterized protein YtfP